MASLARAIAVLGAVSVIGTITQVAKGKLGAIFLGASGIGVLSQLTLLYSLLFLFAGLGFFNGVMRRIALAIKDGDSGALRSQMNSVSLFLGFVSLGITAGCLGFAAPISDFLFLDGGERSDLVSLIILAVPIAVQQRIFRAYLNATQNLKGIARAQTSADILSVMIFAIAAWRFDIAGAVFAFLGLHALLLLGLAIFVVRSGGVAMVVPHPRHFRWNEIVPNFGDGAVVILQAGAAGLSALLIGRMVIAFYDLAAAGIFSVGWKVATVYLGALYAAAGSYLLPALMKQDDGKVMAAEVNRAIALYMTILPPVIVGLIVFGDLLIPLLFSKEFLPAVMVMAGLLFGDIFRVTGETMGLALYARRHLFAYTAISMFNYFSFVALSWWLLPKYGLLGIALAYVIVQASVFIVMLEACRRAFGMRLKGEALRPFVLALGAVGPLSFAQLVGLPLFAKLILASSLGVLWLFGNWRSAGLANIRSILSKRLSFLWPT